MGEYPKEDERLLTPPPPLPPAPPPQVPKKPDNASCLEAILGVGISLWMNTVSAAAAATTEYNPIIMLGALALVNAGLLILCIRIKRPALGAGIAVGAYLPLMIYGVCSTRSMREAAPTPPPSATSPSSPTIPPRLTNDSLYERWWLGR